MKIKPLLTCEVECNVEEESDVEKLMKKVKKSNYKDILDNAKEIYKIDDVVKGIERELEIMYNLYKVFTNELTGRSCCVFDNHVVGYKDILDLNGLKFSVIPHGFTEAFFLVYEKPKFLWFKNRKSFYFAKGYTFYAEHERSTRYDFELEDYNFILSVLNKETERLQNMIDDIRKMNNKN